VELKYYCRDTVLVLLRLTPHKSKDTVEVFICPLPAPVYVEYFNSVFAFVRTAEWVGEAQLLVVGLWLIWYYFV